MRVIFFIAFSLYSAILYSQENTDNLIETTLNDSDAEEENLENENIIEDLLKLRQNPININDTLADFTTLYQYNLFSPLQAEQLKEYIKQHGDLLTTKELYAVPYITYEQANQLFPYLKTEANDAEEVHIKHQLLHSKKSLIVRNQFVVEQQKGFKQIDSTGSKYLGNRQRLYFKYRQQYKDKLSFGLLGDKDAGEQFFGEHNKQGFDFYSAHIAYKPREKWLNEIMLGDYEVKMGQGLVQWNGFALGKGSDATTVFLKGPRIRPYTSSNEFNFLRGGTAELQLTKNLKSQIWFSNKKIDANINLDSLDTDFLQLQSLQISGLHRTQGEIEDKGAAKERVLGANVDYAGKWFTVGALVQNRVLSQNLNYSDRYYQRFFDTGNQFAHGSVHYAGLRNSLYFFGETAYAGNQSFATINGVQKFFNSGVKATAVYRNYGKSYQSFYASSLSENTRINNEEGVYLGLSYSPIRSLKIQSYFDRFWFPFNRARVDQPSQGTEWFLRADYFTGNSEIELRSRIENKGADFIGNSLPNNQVSNQKRISNRLELRHRPNENWYLKSRVAHTAFETAQKNEHGFLLFQDVVYQFPEQKTKLYGRLATFYTPSFDSRVYAYENDLLYNFSVPAYYGKGVRWYAMASIQPIDRMKFWLKGSQTIFNDREVISSGNNEIDGNTRTDVRFQIQWKF